MLRKVAGIFQKIPVVGKCISRIPCAVCVIVSVAKSDYVPAMILISRQSHPTNHAGINAYPQKHLIKQCCITLADGRSIY